MTIVANDVLALVKHGLFVIRLHYPIFRAGEVHCSCGNPGCKGQGKHPVASAWGKAATQDEEIITEQWRDDRWNVGIIVGPCFGIPADKAIIDIEDDSPEGRNLADTLLKDYPGPAYTSGKSIHRLYRWTPDLPVAEKGIIVVDGLEFRMGRPEKQSQSVAPPSIHHTGAQYQWIEGRSLDDLPIIELPKEVIEFLHEKNHSNVRAGGGTAPNEARKFRARAGKISPGNRHHALLVEANNLWRHAFRIWGINRLEDEDVIEQVRMWLYGANLLVCEPPKDERDVDGILNSSYKFMLEQFAAELAEKEKMTTPPDQAPDDDRSFGAWLGRNGISLRVDPTKDPTTSEPDRIDEWVCDWSMKYITKSDEDLIGVQIGESAIEMNAVTFESATAFARKVQQDTHGKFILNKSFTIWNWKSIWEGRQNDKKRTNGITRGLREYLTSNAGVTEKKENGITENVEDLILAMAGPFGAIQEELIRYKDHGHTFKGRLKIIPGSGLTEIRAPEDPLTGYYTLSGEQVFLLVKFDEVTRRYRGAFGGAVQTRQIAECIEALGFKKQRYRSGPMEGRWYSLEKTLE